MPSLATSSRRRRWAGSDAPPDRTSVGASIHVATRAGARVSRCDAAAATPEAWAASALLHRSDTHFGTERAHVIEALVRLAAEQKPDVAVLSGDIAQRVSLAVRRRPPFDAPSSRGGKAQRALASSHPPPLGGQAGTAVSRRVREQGASSVNVIRYDRAVRRAGCVAERWDYNATQDPHGPATRAMAITRPGRHAKMVARQPPKAQPCSDIWSARQRIALTRVAGRS